MLPDNWSGIYFYKTGIKQDDPQRFSVNDIRPGGNRAVLTLANGKKIGLTDAKNTELAKESGISITKTADGQLIYKISEETPAENKESYNSIETPKGGQYELQLSDGTKVWLNAASSLKYPSGFGLAKERKVELTGEAYFEVASNKAVPFIVYQHNQVIEVLGTHFNINSYADEPVIRTTLLEGSIKLSQTGGARATILKPGQQAVLHDRQLKIKEVDPMESIGWKNGEFLFKDEDFHATMRKIARWYDVEIIYDASAPQDFIGGSLRRRSISAALTLIELTGKVHFKIEGRRVTVTK